MNNSLHQKIELPCKKIGNGDREEAEIVNISLYNIEYGDGFVDDIRCTINEFDDENEVTLLVPRKIAKRLADCIYKVLDFTE